MSRTSVERRKAFFECVEWNRDLSTIMQEFDRCQAEVEEENEELRAQIAEAVRLGEEVLAALRPIDKPFRQADRTTDEREVYTT